MIGTIVRRVMIATVLLAAGAAGVALVVEGPVAALFVVAVAALFLVAGMAVAIGIAVDGLRPPVSDSPPSPTPDPFWDAVGRVIRDADRRARGKDAQL